MRWKAGARSATAHGEPLPCHLRIARTSGRRRHRSEGFATSSRGAEVCLHRELIQHRIDEIKSRIRKGGLFECTLRGLIYVGLARGRVDQRGMNALRRIRGLAGMPRLTLAQFKAMAREQFFMLCSTRKRHSRQSRRFFQTTSHNGRRRSSPSKVLEASGELTGDAVDRLTRVKVLFELGKQARGPPYGGSP